MRLNKKGMTDIEAISVLLFLIMVVVFTMFTSSSQFTSLMEDMYRTPTIRVEWYEH